MNLKTLKRKLMTIMNKYETAGFLMAFVRNHRLLCANFFDGEADYYTRLCKTVAENLLAADLPDTAEFEVNTSGIVEYCYSGKKLPLFSLLMDRFPGRPRDCEKYCAMWYQWFIGALGVCIALNRKDTSQATNKEHIVKTLVIVNHRETAKAFADYTCDFAKINQGDTLKITAVVDLAYGWNAGLDRIVVDTDVALQWVKNLERYIPCARGWTTTKAIIENGAGNDELFDLAVALYLLEHVVAPPHK